MSSCISKSEKETEKIAFKLVKKFKGGEVIGLIGNLGAGKTVFVRGLAKAFGIKRPIASPSFVLMKIYKIQNLKAKSQNKFKTRNLKFGVQYFLHIDAYRLKSAQDLIDVGILDWLGKKNTITVIEWANRVKKILAKNTIKIKIKFGKKENERIIKIQK